MMLLPRVTVKKCFEVNVLPAVRSPLRGKYVPKGG